MSDLALNDHLTPLQAGLKLGKSPQTIKLWATRGQIAAVRTPLGTLIPQSEVDRLLREMDAQRASRSLSAEIAREAATRDPRERA